MLEEKVNGLVEIFPRIPGSNERDVSFRYVELLRVFKYIEGKYNSHGRFFRVNVDQIDSPKTGLRNLSDCGYFDESENAVYFNLFFTRFDGDEFSGREVGEFRYRLSRLRDDALIKKLTKVQNKEFRYGKDAITIRRPYLSTSDLEKFKKVYLRKNDRVSEYKRASFRLYEEKSNTLPVDYGIIKISVNELEKRVVLSIDNIPIGGVEEIKRSG